MSVVNRMLLDIDKRHGAADVQARGPFPDIRSVSLAARPPARGVSGFAAGAVAIAVIGALALNYAGFFDRDAPLPAKVPTPAAARAAPPHASPPPPADAVASQPAAVVEAPPAAARKEPASKASRPRVPVESFRLARELTMLEERPAPVAPPPAPRIAAPGTAVPPLRQVAADETIAAARTLWNEGSRVGALATLREALGIAEARNPAAATPIARELARLEIAENRPQAALEVLRRLDAALADDAEAWALRGNAEQRLAQHAESARSYLAALRLRPAEGRWMLGAAISLAADGKLDDAQAWTERARERGVLTPAIEAYLQQLGIAVRR